MTSNVFIGRQPIVDARERVHAYEILYRASADSNSAVFEDANQAATQVVVNTFMQLGPDAVLGTGKGFFNVTASVLQSGVLSALPPERIVLEILEDIEPSDDVVRACENLRDKGFTLALDDYVPDDPREELLELVDWVKVDLLATDPKKLRRLTRWLQRRDVRLLAEKVSTPAEFETCKKLGFHSYQGFYFAHAEIVSGRAPSAEANVLLDLMQRVQAEEETREIAEVIKPHVAIGMGLMRIANSAAMARTQNLSRVEDALIYLGRRQLQRWLAILLFAQNRPGGQRDPLLITAAKRGRLLELLAGDLSEDSDFAELAFLVGVLASVEALLGRPKQEILADLNLAPIANAALLGYEGPLGALLRLAEAVERCRFGQVEEQLEALGISARLFQARENQAFEWVHGLAEGMGA